PAPSSTRYLMTIIDRRTAVTAVGLFLLGSCAGPTSPEIPPGAVPLDPLPVYAEWWKEVQDRSGIWRDVGHVRWFLVPGGLFWSERDLALSSGRWIPDGRIFIAEGWEGDPRTVKHEMLHEIL